MGTFYEWDQLIFELWNLEYCASFPFLDIAEDHLGLEFALEPNMHINRHPYSQTSTKLEGEKGGFLRSRLKSPRRISRT